MNLLQKLHVFGFDLHEVKLYTNIRCKRNNTHDWLIHITHDYSSINKIIQYKDKELPLLFIFLVDDEEFTTEEIEQLNNNNNDSNIIVNGDIGEFCVPISWVGS